jgi:glycosyltransferase involved in cell wall biosynthesis
MIRSCCLVASSSRAAGGLFDAVRWLGQELATSGEIGVEIFSLEDEFTALDAVAWDPLPVRSFPVAGPRFFGYSPTLARAVAATDLQVLHLHGLWMYPSVVSHRWGHSTRRPYLVSPHGMLDPWALRNSGVKKRLARWIYEGRNLRGAGCLHSLCAAETLAIRALGLTNPVCEIPNGVRLPRAKPPDNPPWAGLIPQGMKVLLYFGRLHPKKQLPALIRGWQMAKQAGPGAVKEWTLAVVGWDEDGHRAELEGLISQLALSDVHFFGPQHGTRKHDTLSSADAFIIPSISEGLPMGVLEAWSHGLPVLMTKQCNLPEGFAEGAAVEIAPDAAGVARGLSVLFEMGDAQRKAMGARGLKLVQGRFDCRRTAEQMRDVYLWLVGGGPRPGSVVQ